MYQRDTPLHYTVIATIEIRASQMSRRRQTGMCRDTLPIWNVGFDRFKDLKTVCVITDYYSGLDLPLGLFLLTITLKRDIRYTKFVMVAQGGKNAPSIRLFFKSMCVFLPSAWLWGKIMVGKPLNATGNHTQDCV